jgi:predicted kinase
MENVQTSAPFTIAVPARTLMVLCGPAASGKSTFASQRFAPSISVSSDRCRELICDDDNNQLVNRDAFDLFYYIIHKRMHLSRFTVADSTALQVEARRRLLALAGRHSYLTCLLIFNVPLATCLERNRRRGRLVEERVIGYHAELLQQVMRNAAQEGWQRIYTLDERNGDVGVEVIT